MKLKFSTTVLTTAIAISGAIGLTGNWNIARAEAASSQLATVFKCIESGNGYATIAQRGDYQTPPMITWNDPRFGAQFTPQKRCEIVSQRLTDAVAQNGGMLSLLRLTYGDLHNSSVICYINSDEEKCNDSNLLLTLNSSDRGHERKILEQLVNFATNASDEALSRGTLIINFGEVVERQLGGANSPVGIERQQSINPPISPKNHLNYGAGIRSGSRGPI